jgi:hypothetical protein
MYENEKNLKEKNFIQPVGLIILSCHYKNKLSDIKIFACDISVLWLIRKYNYIIKTQT